MATSKHKSCLKVVIFICVSFSDYLCVKTHNGKCKHVKITTINCIDFKEMDLKHFFCMDFLYIKIKIQDLLNGFI